jgi:hypothetical protein
MTFTITRSSNAISEYFPFPPAFNFPVETEEHNWDGDNGENGNIFMDIFNFSWASQLYENESKYMSLFGQDYEQLEIIRNFTTKIIDNMVELDSDIVKYVDKNLWNLI